ncbi:MAG TPA: ABC transporter ATP-binding protein [Geomonas sp.]|nr:ABC transporter ATP-binding protein [Geomonas sp.]
MVKVEGVSHCYGKREVLRGIDLQVERGEIFGFLGPNGAGKSTLLKAVVGLLSPSAGNITIDGINLKADRRKALSRVGFVPQRVGFARHLSIQEVLEFHASLKQLPPDAVTRSLKRVGLERASKRLVGELSGGTLQRLGIAQAILADPPLLVLDEPTVGLDPQVSAEFRELLKELNREGVTAMVTSHLLGEVELQASRVAVLKEGSVIAQGTVAQLLTDSGLPSSLWVKPSGDPGRIVPVLRGRGYQCEQVGADLRIPVTAEQALQALDALRQAGVEIISFWTTTPTLEEVFRWVVERSGNETNSCGGNAVAVDDCGLHGGTGAGPLGFGYVRPVPHDLG